MHTSTLPRPPGSAPSGPAATWPRRSTPRPSPARRRWERPALLALLVGTAVLYLWGLSASGYANDFYAAAVHAGTQSWKAWLFGSLDSGNAITVDKPPAALWVMTLSARIFGFSSWSLLVPQALMGVGSVALLHAAVRRWAGPVAGLLAGAALALTPAAVLMFRFDNPDALLVLLLVAGAYATVRAIDAVTVRASTWWLVAAGAAVGFGFLTKMGQALLVVPGVRAGLPGRRSAAAAHATGAAARRARLDDRLGRLVHRPGRAVACRLAALYRRLDDELAAGAGARLQRSGPHPRRERQRRGVAPGGGNAGFGGEAGILRLFTDELGLEISWLLPAALIALVALVVVTGRRPRPDRRVRQRCCGAAGRW